MQIAGSASSRTTMQEPCETKYVHLLKCNFSRQPKSLVRSSWIAGLGFWKTSH